MKKLTILLVSLILLSTPCFSASFNLSGISGAILNATASLTSDAIEMQKYQHFGIDVKATSVGGIKAPGAKPATFVEHGLTGVWQFADVGVGNEQTVSGTLKIPSSMDRTVVPLFKVGWSATGVSPGNGEWQLEYNDQADVNRDGTISFGDAQEIMDNALGGKK